MTDYLVAPIEVDQQDVLQLAYDYIQTIFPNWVPSDGNLDVALLEAISTDAASLRELAADVPDTIFRYFGATIVQVEPIDASPATSTVQFTVQDNAGYTIPGGTQVSIPATGDTVALFETLVDAVVLPGNTTISPVTIQAVDPGAASTALGAVNQIITLIDSLAFVTQVKLLAPTANGQDAEDDETYLNRLVGEMQLLSPRLIIPSDFAQEARSNAGVTRAVAIDGYDPAGGGTFNNAREVAVAAVDANGIGVSAGIKSTILADLQAKREVNFIVNMIDPKFTNIDVTFDLQTLPGFTTASVHDAVIAAIQAWLQPYAWGVDPLTNDPTSWVETTKVRYLDLVSVVRAVGGVAYINTLTVGIHGGSMGTTDVTLASPAALTTVGTITGTAH